LASCFQIVPSKRKHVGRAAISVGAEGSHEREVSLDVGREAELVSREPVAGQKLLLQHPVGTIEAVDVGRAAAGKRGGGGDRDILVNRAAEAEGVVPGVLWGMRV
jgi:hypothetical protein